MVRKTILILEDEAERITAFRRAVDSLDRDFSLQFWHEAPGMIAECSAYLDQTCLISLDHDLHPMPGATRDPLTGLEVATFLAQKPPVCPVIIHTSNPNRRWSMFNEFRFGQWQAEVIAPLEQDWIRKSWLPKARTLIGI